MDWDARRGVKRDGVQHSWCLKRHEIAGPCSTVSLDDGTPEEINPWNTSWPWKGRVHDGDLSDARLIMM